MRRSHFSTFTTGILALLLATLACSIPTVETQPPTPDLTSAALNAQQTELAAGKAALDARETAAAQEEPSSTPPPSATPEPPTVTPEPPTETPRPTDTSAPVLAPSATDTQQPTITPVDIEAKIKGANVLVFEDMAANYNRKRLVHQAVSEMNFSGGRVIEVGDALGKFKEHLLNTSVWDLIVVAAEYRTTVQGEFWQYVKAQVDRGAALVIEVWYLNRHYTDIQPLLSQCGLKYHKNWDRGDRYRLEDYAIYWLQPDHPFFLPPNDPVSLANPNYLYWVPPRSDDAGDLLQLDTTGDAVLLAGTHPDIKSQYGVLGVCMGGTMVVQTYSTNDYNPNETVKMWKNAMRYTLTNKFLKSE